MRTFAGYQCCNLKIFNFLALWCLDSRPVIPHNSVPKFAHSFLISLFISSSAASTKWRPCSFCWISLQLCIIFFESGSNPTTSWSEARLSWVPFAIVFVFGMQYYGYRLLSFYVCVMKKKMYFMHRNTNLCLMYVSFLLLFCFNVSHIFFDELVGWRLIVLLPSRRLNSFIAASLSLAKCGEHSFFVYTI